MELGRRGILSEQDHTNFDALIRHALEAYRAGTLTLPDAVGGLAEFVAALDIGNATEVQAWLKEGRKRFTK